MSHHIVR